MNTGKPLFGLIRTDGDPEKPISVYMGVTSHEQALFGSISQARKSNCHDIYADRTAYKVVRYRLVVDEVDVDPPTEKDIAKAKKDSEFEARVDELLAQRGEAKDGMEGVAARYCAAMDLIMIDSMQGIFPPELPNK